MRPLKKNAEEAKILMQNPETNFSDTEIESGELTYDELATLYGKGARKFKNIKIKFEEKDKKIGKNPDEKAIDITTLNEASLIDCTAEIPNDTKFVFISSQCLPKDKKLKLSISEENITHENILQKIFCRTTEEKCFRDLWLQRIYLDSQQVKQIDSNTFCNLLFSENKLKQRYATILNTTITDCFDLSAISFNHETQAEKAFIDGLLSLNFKNCIFKEGIKLPDFVLNQCKNGSKIKEKLAKENVSTEALRNVLIEASQSLKIHIDVAPHQKSTDNYRQRTLTPIPGITTSQNQFLEKLMNGIHLNGVIVDNPTELLNKIYIAYAEIKKNDFLPRFMQSDYFNELLKKFPNASAQEKLWEIARHVKKKMEEQGAWQKKLGMRSSRTYLAVRYVLQCIKSVPLQSVSSQGSPSSLTASIADGSPGDSLVSTPRVVAPQNTPPSKPSYIPDDTEKEAIEFLKVALEKGSRNIVEITKAATSLKQKNNFVRGEDQAKTILKNALDPTKKEIILPDIIFAAFHLCSVANPILANEYKKNVISTLNKAISPSGSDFFGFDHNTKEDINKRKAREDEIIAAYQFLESIAGKDAVKIYDEIFRDEIYPLFLEWVCHAKGVCDKNGVQDKYARYSLFERFGSVSRAIPHSALLIHLSKHRKEYGLSPEFFASSTPAGKQFIKLSQEEQMKMPLAKLHKAKRLDDGIYNAVCDKLKNNKADEPARTQLEKQYYIAELIKCGEFKIAYFELLAYKTQWPDVNFGDALSDAIQVLIQEADTELFKTQKNDGPALKKLRNFLNSDISEDEKFKNWTIINDAKKMVTMADHSYLTSDFYSIVTDFIRDFSSTIDKKYLNNMVNAFSDHDLVLFIENKDLTKWLVWFDSLKNSSVLSDSKKALVNGLRSIFENVKNNKPINANGELRNFIADIYQVQPVILALKNILNPILNYDKIKNSKQNGKFIRDLPKDTKQIDNVSVNYPKYKIAIAVEDILLSAMHNLEQFDGNPDKIQKTFDNIIASFEKMIEEFDDNNNPLSKEKGKNFYILLTTALRNLYVVKESWANNVGATINLGLRTIEPANMTQKFTSF